LSPIAPHAEQARVDVLLRVYATCIAG
jgi:hypothetical protein